MKFIPKTALELMCRLDFVTWDRLAFATDPEDSSMEVFGWIDREDGRHDFLVLRFTDLDGFMEIAHTTSSAERSADIIGIIGPHEWHSPCERVEVHADREVLPNVVRYERVVD